MKKKVKNKNFKDLVLIIPKVLVILMPFFLVSGPFLTDLAISTCALYFFFYYKEEYFKKILKSKFFYIYFFFILVIISSSLFSEYKLDSLKSSLFYFRFGFFVIFFSFLISKDIKILEKIFLSLIIVYLSLFIDGTYQLFNDYNLFNIKMIETSRVSSFFGDELIMGSYTTRLFPLILGLFFFIFFKNKKFSLKNYKYSFFLFFIIFISLYLVILSGERTAFVLFLISNLLIFILLNISIKEKINLCFILMFSIFIFFSTDLNQRIVKTTFSQMNIDYFKTVFFSENNIKNNNQESKNYIVHEQYEKIFKTGIAIFSNNPFTGVGIGNFETVCEERYKEDIYMCSTHPHNTYIQLLSETGIISFIIILFLFFFILFILIKKFYFHFKFKKIKYYNLQVCLLTCLLISIFPFTPSGNFFNNWLSSIYYYPLGILLWTLSEDNS